MNYNKLKYFKKQHTALTFLHWDRYHEKLMSHAFIVPYPLPLTDPISFHVLSTYVELYILF
jgi:hypothetical protein